MHRSAGIQRPGVLDEPGARITGDYEPPDVVVGLELFGLLKKQYVSLNTELSIQPQPRYSYHSNRNKARAEVNLYHTFVDLNICMVTDRISLADWGSLLTFYRSLLGKYWD